MHEERLGARACAIPGRLSGVLRVAAVTEEPKNLNPLLAGTTIEIFIDRLMFEPLLSADARGNTVPMLAAVVPAQANGGISADGLTITYHLRRDARWSDGVPVTARDVAWSWQAIENPNNDAVSRHGYDEVRASRHADAHTAVVHLKRRFSPFVNTFFAESDQPYEILPAHVLARYANVNSSPFNARPSVGDGPFHFVEWRRADRILLEANPRFFQGAPRLKRSRNTLRPQRGLRDELAAYSRHRLSLSAVDSNVPDATFLARCASVWVNANGFEGVEFNLSHPLLSDARVRTAIAAALDKPSFTAALTHGQTVPATEDLPNWMWAFDPSVRSVPFDLARAKQLLARAGWVASPDGIVRKQGQPLELLLVTDNASATHRSESILIQAALKRIGVAVEVKYYPFDLLYAPQAMGGIQHGGKFDMLAYDWYAGIDPDNSSELTCNNFPPHGYNDPRYCSAAMDAAQAVALSHYDRATRRAAYSTIEHLLAGDNPILFFWWQRQQEAISVDFHGFDPNPVVESWDAWRWSI